VLNVVDPVAILSAVDVALPFCPVVVLARANSETTPPARTGVVFYRIHGGSRRRAGASGLNRLGIALADAAFKPRVDLPLNEAHGLFAEIDRRWEFAAVDQLANPLP
jgi:hypothetical protein